MVCHPHSRSRMDCASALGLTAPGFMLPPASQAKIAFFVQSWTTADFNLGASLDTVCNRRVAHPRPVRTSDRWPADLMHLAWSLHS